MTRKTKVAIVVAGVLGAMQLVQCQRTNPTVTADVHAPADVEAVLRRACYDCHSNETVWPWYSRVAPVSWLLNRDVVEGRRHLNFSEWDRLPADKRAKRIRAVGGEVERGDMPLWFYKPLHPSAHLSEGDKMVLERWSKQD